MSAAIPLVAGTSFGIKSAAMDSRWQPKPALQPTASPRYAQFAAAEGQLSSSLGISHAETINRALEGKKISTETVEETVDKSL